MSDDAPPKKQAAGGSPAWVMTFADLMSLLMCFFVLLLSFSEMDVSKYKQLAGSMANAFGVQREIKVKEPPKGINIIAREFSPGRPEPTPFNVVKQQTTAELKIHLEVGGHKKRPVPTPRSSQFDPKETASMKPEKPAENQADQELEQKKGLKADDQSGAQPGESAEELPGKQLAQQGEEKETGKAGKQLDDATAQEILDAREAQEKRRQLEANARKISSELREQIQDGAIDVEREGQKIVIRIREKASFGSGTADVIAKFKPVLWRLGEIIEGTEGRIIVAGHTDNVPIHTRRYRSNWELSSGRAVSVVHELLWQTAIPLDRFLVQGHGETQPIAPNDTPANRAKNRRVEIILMQGDDREADSEISQKGVTDKPEPKPNLPPPPARVDAKQSDDQPSAGIKAAAGVAVGRPAVTEEKKEPSAVTPAKNTPAPAAGSADKAAARTAATVKKGSGVSASARPAMPEEPATGVSTGAVKRPELPGVEAGSDQEVDADIPPATTKASVGSGVSAGVGAAVTVPKAPESNQQQGTP